MSLLLTVLFIAVLAGAIVFFAIMGFRQFRRSRAIARKAYDMGLHFSQSDLFDIARRYGNFVLISRGHSGMVSNVTYGRIEGMSVRAFDFCSEMGHGTRRIMHRDGAVVIETRMQLPSLLMWNENELSFAPITIIDSDKHVGSWLCSGDMSLAGEIARDLPEMGPAGINIQARGNSLMLSVRPKIHSSEYILSMVEIGKIAQCLAKWLARENHQPS